MTKPRNIKGQCLCGAVQVTATVTKPIRRACHCDMCRRLTSAMFMSLAVDEGSLAFTGPVSTYRSSDWAERGFCAVCGSVLFYATLADKQRHPAAGLFEGVDDAPLKLEFFSDMCPQGYALAGEHRRMTTDETIAMFAGSEGETT